MTKEFGFRRLFFFVGLMVMGLSVALTVKGQRFGVGSWSVLHIGLFKKIGLSIGLWSIIVGIIIITIASIVLREFPKVGNFMNMICVGLFKNIGFSIGLWSIIVGIIIVTIASIGLREFPKVGTFMNMICVGLFIDFFNWIIPNPTIFSTQLSAFILGVVLLAIGCGIYIA